MRSSFNTQFVSEAIVAPIAGYWRSWKRLAGDPSCAEVLIVMGGIPICLLLIAAMDMSQEWLLQLDSHSIWSDPATFWAAFASSYVHLSTQHLASNILGYILLMGVLYPLSVQAGWKRELAWVTLLSLLFVPFLSSQYSLILDAEISNGGFSSILSALLAFLVFAWFKTLERWTDLEIQPYWPMLPISLVLAFPFLIPTGVGMLGRPLYPLAAGFLILSAILAVDVVFRVDRQQLIPIWNTVYSPLFGISGLMFIWMAAGMLFYVPLPGNFLGHLAGFLFGVILGLLVGASERWSAVRGRVFGFSRA